jgi:beta-D-galactosyl-(1->4)-L-rhamnose phosphorylase
LGHLFGIGYDDGSRKCLQKYPIKAASGHFITKGGIDGLSAIENAYVDAPDTLVLAADGASPTLTVRTAGAGRAVYLSGYRFSPQSAFLIARAVAWAAKEELSVASLQCGNPAAECAVFDGCVAIVNHTDRPQRSYVPAIAGDVTLEPYAQKILRTP